ncbi:MAG TPA: tyrosine-type recombinase/integrase [Xanthobacteraceae bacterium]
MISTDEAKRLLAVAESLKSRVMLSLSYGCGLRAGEVVRLKVKHIDSAQKIIRVEQSKGRKDRNVMLSPEMLDLLRQWWKVRPSRYDAETPLQERSIPVVFVCRSVERASARLNCLLALQITAEPSLLSIQADRRKCPGALYAAQSLRLSPRAAIDAARFPSKSP